MQQHESALAEMRAYFNEAAHADLDHIARLKEEAAELKRREAAANKQMADVVTENKLLVEPLAQVLFTGCPSVSMQSYSAPGSRQAAAVARRVCRSSDGQCYRREQAAVETVTQVLLLAAQLLNAVPGGPREQTSSCLFLSTDGRPCG
jgi:hypothetical protein